VAAKVAKQLDILVQTEELADQFDGQDAVVQPRRKAALADRVEVESSQLVIEQTENIQHKISQSHGASPLKNSFFTAFLEEST
jgi:hypothetical protein